MKNNMPKLKILAEQNHVYIDEDMGNEFSLCCDDGWSWELGSTQTMVYAYGSEGCYDPEQRQIAIKAAIADLEGNHQPTEHPYVEAS